MSAAKRQLLRALRFQMAEESESRTHQGRLTPLTGFEVRVHHRVQFPSVVGKFYRHEPRFHLRRRKTKDVARYALQQACVADAPSELDAVKELQNFDREIASDAGAVTKI